MKYSPTHYATALYQALQGKTGEERGRVIKNFSEILLKNKDKKLLPVILARYEKVFLKDQGLTKIEASSSHVLQESVRESIQDILGEKTMLEEKVKPELVAGITLLVNDTYYIDASAKTKISNLFP